MPNGFGGCVYIGGSFGLNNWFIENGYYFNKENIGVRVFCMLVFVSLYIFFFFFFKFFDENINLYFLNFSRKRKKNIAKKIYLINLP